MSEPGREEEASDLSSLFRECAEANLYLDLDRISRDRLEALRESLQGEGEAFDARALVEACLKDRSPPDPDLCTRAYRLLHAKVAGAGLFEGRPRRGRKLRRVRNRLLGTLVGQLLVFGIHVTLVLAGLVAVKRIWPEADLYAWAERILGTLGSILSQILS